MSHPVQLPALPPLSFYSRFSHFLQFLLSCSALLWKSSNFAFLSLLTSALLSFRSSLCSYYPFISSTCDVVLLLVLYSNDGVNVVMTCLKYNTRLLYYTVNKLHQQLVLKITIPSKINSSGLILPPTPETWPFVSCWKNSIIYILCCSVRDL